MPSIHVCSLARLHDAVDMVDASHVVSLLADASALERPAPIAADNHLTLLFNDITEPADGLVMAGPEDIETLLSFARDWNRAAPLVIHCFAGISRSTAAAFITLCAIQPQDDEAAHALRIREASPTATPNRHMVALADDLLGRSGRMVAAVEAIGRGETAGEGIPFTLTIEPQGGDGG